MQVDVYQPGRRRKPFPAFGLFTIFFFLIAFADSVRAENVYRIKDAGRERWFEVAEGELFSGGKVVRVNPEDVRTRGVRDVARRMSAGPADIPALVLYEQGATHSLANRRFLSEQVLVAYVDEASLARAANACGAIEIIRPDYAPGYAVLRFSDALGSTFEATKKLAGMAGVTVEGPLLKRFLSPRYVPADPLVNAQWHLRNTGQAPGILAGLDIRVTNAWAWGFTGEGVVIGVVDDGLDYRHPDLSPNYLASYSRNWNGAPGGVNDPRPMPANDESHGTSVAGLAAGRWNNGVGISGVAPLARLAGLRLIAQPVGDYEEAESASHRNDLIHIKNNSWGPSAGDDCQFGLAGPAVLMKQALESSVIQGRGGLGTIHVWAGGNDRENCQQDANTDGYANSMYTISVAAIGNNGRYASYSDPGACHVVSAPGSDADMVTTANIGEGNYPGNSNYKNSFNGTSSAAPLVSGVIALMLEANPGLGWRDVQEILIRSARRIDPGDSGWANNSAGFHFNHNYGAGMVDASAAVAMTYYWTNLAVRVTHTVASNNLNRWIPENCQPVEIAFTNARAMRLEHVTITVDVEHAYRGDLQIELVAPGGMRSILARSREDAGPDYPDWTFMTVRHWGESGQGVWRLRFTDCQELDEGYLNSASISFYGTDADGLAPAGAPIPLTPSGLITNRNPVFNWSPGKHQAWYRLYVADGNNAGVLDQWIQGATSYQYPGMLKTGSYTWYVVGWDSSGLGPWSSGATFAIPLQTPQKVSLLSPTGAQSDFSLPFRWTEDARASWYLLWVGESSGKQLLSKWYASTGSTQMQVVVSGIQPSTSYNWYVRPWGPDGFGPWSDAGAFTSPSGQASLISPVGVITNIRPTLAWSSAAGATWYRVYMIDAISRGKVVDNWTQQASFVLPVDLGSSSYTFWIGAWGPATQRTIWSDSLSFSTVDIASPSMVLIPKGEFMMGATTNVGHETINSATPQHKVSVSEFYMDKYEVTKGLWDDIYRWATSNGYSFGSIGSGKATNHPVHSVDWYDAIAWCNARSQQSGFVPCYTNANGAVYTNSTANNFDGGCNWSANGYRLPTEAEWEKAARGGVANQRFPWGDTISHNNANYDAYSGFSYDKSPTQHYHPMFDRGEFPYTSPVAYFSPNGYGLYDMAGNVYEWCWDWSSSLYYAISPSMDPTGPEAPDVNQSQVYRVLRGGSWLTFADGSRVARRNGLNPGGVGQNTGFRCVKRM